ncbi:MAG: Zn-ribbon domain-containing OB-fold protein [Pseudomonadota bacterium]
MSYGKPLPRLNADSRPFWEGCRQHRLRFQRCSECAHVRWPPSIICPQCHSKETEWITASGKGRLYTYVVYHKAFHPGFANDLPYVVAVVELDEGPHLLTNMVGCNPGELHCDMLVEVLWEDITEEVSLPKFRPSS